jgi:hypothetical protein
MNPPLFAAQLEQRHQETRYARKAATWRLLPLREQ